MLFQDDGTRARREPRYSSVNYGIGEYDYDFRVYGVVDGESNLIDGVHDYDDAVRMADEQADLGYDYGYVTTRRGAQVYPEGKK